MALTAQQLTDFRKREWSQAQIREAKTGSLLVAHETISGCEVEIDTDVKGGDYANLKLDGLKKAVKIVVAKGFQLPPLRFVITGADGVENVAFMGNAAGGRKATIYLGPKMWTKNTGGMTGVADQNYDSTMRFFGNPKQHAQATTIVVHELGHVLHELLDEQAFWTNHEPATMASAAVWGAGAVEVSLYATKAPLEFAAEVFAGVLSGKKYTLTVRNAYAAVGGPTVANFFS